MKRVRIDLRPLVLVLGAMAGLGCKDSPPESPPPAAAKPMEFIDTSRFVASGMVAEGLKKEGLIGAPVRAVFERITTEAGLKQGLGWTAKIDLRIGGAYEIYFDSKAEVGAQGTEGSQILSYIPNRMISFSWNAPLKFAEERAKRTWVVIALDPVGQNETWLTVTHVGFGEGGNWGEVRKYFDGAWTGFGKRLAESFGTRPTATRPESRPAPPR